jgi:hypothetical protein
MREIREYERDERDARSKKRCESARVERVCKISLMRERLMAEVNGRG